MTFICNRKALLDELALLSTVAEAKTTMPILATTKFDFDGSLLILTATNMDTSLVTSLVATGDSWSGCVPSKQLYELTRLFNGEAIEFAPDEGRVTIKWGKSRHRLMLHDVAAFPWIAQPSGSKVSVQGEALRNALTRVLPCVTTEESRYTMQGVKFEGKDGTLKLIATNGHRLGVASLAIEGDISTLIPVEPLAVVLKTNSETIDIQADENRATFHCGPRQISAQLIAGTFPNWEMIVPKNQPYSCEFATSELISALHRANVTRAEIYKAGEGRILAGVKMVLDSRSITVATDESDRGNCEEPITATGNVNGNSIALRINPDYIMDFLRYSGERVKCELKDGMNALTFTDSSSFQYIVMPMRL